MIGVATGGLVINLVGLWILEGGRSDSLNVRGAFLHVLSDTLASVGVILSGVGIWYFGWLWLDPAVSVIVSVLVLLSAWHLVREALDVLMETAPSHLDPEEIRETLLDVDGVHSAALSPRLDDRQRRGLPLEPSRHRGLGHRRRPPPDRSQPPDRRIRDRAHDDPDRAHGRPRRRARLRGRLRSRRHGRVAALTPPPRSEAFGPRASPALGRLSGLRAVSRTLGQLDSALPGAPTDVNVTGDMNVSTPSRDAGRAARSDARKSATRLRLLAAGGRLFARKGPRDVTSHEIAAEAGYASGTFYLHFKDKHALFSELADRAASELEARIETVFANKTDPVDILHAHADALIGFAEEHRDLIRILFRPDAEVGDQAERILQRLADGLVARRRERMASLDAADCFETEVLAQAVVGMWSRVLIWWAEDPSRADREDLMRTLTHFHLHGSGGSPAGPCGVA